MYLYGHQRYIKTLFYPVVREFQAYIESHNLFAKNDRVLVAVSGGRDSMVLADLFRRAGYAFSIAHANFQLRGEASDADEKLVTSWANEHHISCYVKRFDTKKMAEVGKGSTQMTARDLRYAWFEELCAQEGYACVATAHHQQDALESVLLHLSRGTGYRGMAGIVPSSQGRIRPLLFANRAKIDAYVQQEGVPYRDDESNAEVKYRRNHIRHQVIPELETLNPSLLQTFGPTHERLLEAQHLLTQHVEDWLRSHGGYDKEASSLPIIDLLDHAAPRVVLDAWLSPWGFNYTQVQELAAALSGLSGKHWDSATHRVQVDRTQVLLSPLPVIYEPLAWSEDQPHKAFPEGVLIREVIPGAGQFPASPAIAWLASDTSMQDWVVRPWQEGDRFVPLGMTGKKKVSDFLIDSKIPVNLKSRVWVLQIEGQIAWVIGYRLDDRFKVSDPKDPVIQLTFERA